MQQLSLAFEPGIGTRNRSLREHMVSVIYARGLVAVAGKLDVAPSKLSEKLAGSDSGGKCRGMTVDELERYISSEGDLSPIFYLADKFCRDPGVVQQEALAALAMLADRLPALLQAAGMATNGRPAARKAR